MFASRRVIPLNTKPFAFSLDCTNVSDGAYIVAIRQTLAQEGLRRVHVVAGAGELG